MSETDHNQFENDRDDQKDRRDRRDRERFAKQEWQNQNQSNFLKLKQDQPGSGKETFIDSWIAGKKAERDKKQPEADSQEDIDNIVNDIIKEENERKASGQPILSSEQLKSVIESDSNLYEKYKSALLEKETPDDIKRDKEKCVDNNDLITKRLKEGVDEIEIANQVEVGFQALANHLYESVFAKKRKKILEQANSRKESRMARRLNLSPRIFRLFLKSNDRFHDAYQKTSRQRSSENKEVEDKESVDQESLKSLATDNGNYEQNQDLGESDSKQTDWGDFETPNIDYNLDQPESERTVRQPTADARQP